MAIISNFGVLNVLLIRLPESLNTPSALVFVPHIVTPGTLNTSGHIVPIPIPHRLQCKELKINQSTPFEGTARSTRAHGLWVLDERLRSTHLPLILRNSRVCQDLLTSRFGISLPRIFPSITRIRGKQVKPLHHLFERVPVRKARTSDTDVLLQSKVFDLVKDGFVVKFGRGAVLVGFDRADV